MRLCFAAELAYTSLDVPQIRVALVEDQAPTREGLASLIGGSPGFEISGQYGSMEEALPALERVRPDVLLADIGLAHTRVQDPVEILRRDGIVDLQGFPLRIEVFEQLAALDLRNDVVSFHGDALLLQVGQTNHPRMDLQRLIERIESLGGHCRFEAIQGDRRRPFGAPRFQALGAHRGKVDTHAQLAVDLEALTAEWAGPLLGANAPAAHPSGGAG